MSCTESGLRVGVNTNMIWGKSSFQNVDRIKDIHSGKKISPRGVFNYRNKNTVGMKERLHK